MAADFVEELQRLYQHLPKADVTPFELLDILWLAERLSAPPPITDTAQPSPSSTDDKTPARTAATPSEQKKTASTDSGAPEKTRPASADATQTASQPTAPEVELFTTAVSHAGRSKSIPAVPLRVGGVPGLPGALRIARAMYPLMRRVPSRQAMVLDETATAERTADARFFEEVRRPASAWWLDLALVIDRSGAMEIWDKSIADFRDLLERHRAFRNVRAWDMWEDGVELRFRTSSREKRDATASELTDPTGSQLLIIVSDCVSRPWTDERIPRCLERWSVHGPVAIFQVMPPELWRRTALCYARRALVRAAAPGVPNRYIRDISDVAQYHSGRDDVLVPVTSLDATGISEWSHFFVAAGGASARAYAFPTVIPAEEIEARVQRVAESRSATAAERVTRFDVVATPDAKRLARLLAAAPFRLTPPVIRLIQDKLLPGTSRSAIAEVILAGFLRSEPSPDGDAERTTYAPVPEFADLLLEGASASDLLQLMQTEVSEFVGQPVMNVIDFSALLKGEATNGSLTISAEEIPFARIGVGTLRRVGGRYAEIAREVDQQFAPDVECELPVSNTLRDYLREQRNVITPQQLEDWVTGLRRFGTLVMLHAAMAAADQTRSGRRARTSILHDARECLDRESRDKTLELAALIGAGVDRPPHDSDAATLVAHAIVIAFGSLNRTGEATRSAVLAAFAAAAAEHGNVAELHEAVRKRLLADVVAGEIQVRPELPFRGRVIVAGTVKEVGLPPPTQWAAMQIGKKLAREGFELVVGGWPGVDFLVTSAYVRELELRGGDDVDVRIVQRVEIGQVPNFAGLQSEPVLSWADAVIQQAKAIIVIGPCGIDTLERYARERRVLMLPLTWTGAKVSPPGPRDGHFLDHPDVRSAADAEILTDRAVAAIATLGEKARRDRWREYTHALYSALGEQRPPEALKRKAPHLARFIGAIAADCAAVPLLAIDAAFERLSELASDVADWLVFDILALSEIESDWLPERNFLLRRLTEVANNVAPALLRTWLERRWREVGQLLPQRPIEGLLPVARTVFPDPEAFSAWTQGIAGIGPEECEFRMSIPVAVYRAAARYNRWSIEEILFGLMRRNVPYEIVSKYADAQEIGARVIAYVLMQTNDYRIAATELTRRIDEEVRHAMATRDARALRQLLLAASTASTGLDLPSRRMVARALASAATRLRVIQADDDRLCVDLIQSITRLNQFQEAYEANAMVDEYAALPRIDPKVGSLPPQLRRARFRGDEIEHLFRTGSPGQRIVALKLAAATADGSSFEVIRTALENPAPPQQLAIALAAAEVVSPRLTYAQLAMLLDLLGATDVIPATMAAPVVRRLQRRLRAADCLRYAPVAVIGSNPSRVPLQDFCRALGGELARRELGVIVANPFMAAWLAEGYSAHNPEYVGFVLMRRASDPRPLHEQIPYRTIEGDLQMLREEMLGGVRGAIIIGGRNGTFDEYSIVRRRGLPVVPVGRSGGAAARVAAMAAHRLAVDRLSPELLSLLRNEELSPALASAVAEAMRWSVNVEESQRQEQLEEKQRAATLSTDDLCRAVLKSLGRKHQKRVGNAQLLLTMARQPEAWSGQESSLIHARRFEKEVERLAFTKAPPPVVTELISRSAFAMCILEAAALAREQWEKVTVAHAAEHGRFADAGVDTLDRLAALIRERGEKSPETKGRRAFLLARLQEEIEQLRS